MARWSRWFFARQSTPRKRTSPAFRPELTALEDRVVPTASSSYGNPSSSFPYHFLSNSTPFHAGPIPTALTPPTFRGAAAALAAKRELYISNSGANTIERVDSTGARTAFITGLNNPTGIAFDSTGRLYVANAGDNTIRRFSSSGAALGTFVTAPSAPSGLSFDASGNLLVQTATEVRKYSSTGQDLGTATTGIQNGMDLETETGAIYVANRANPSNAVSRVGTTGNPATFGPGLVAGVALGTSHDVFVTAFSGVQFKEPGF